MDKTNKDPSVITRGTPATPPDPDVVWQVFPPLTAARQDPNVLAAKLQTSLRSKNPYVVAQAAEVGGQTFIGIWYAGGGPHNLDRLRLVPAIPYELITLDLIAGEQLAFAIRFNSAFIYTQAETAFNDGTFPSRDQFTLIDVTYDPAAPAVITTLSGTRAVSGLPATVDYHVSFTDTLSIAPGAGFSVPTHEVVAASTNTGLQGDGWSDGALIAVGAAFTAIGNVALSIANASIWIFDPNAAGYAMSSDPAVPAVGAVGARLAAGLPRALFQQEPDTRDLTPAQIQKLAPRMMTLLDYSLVQIDAFGVVAGGRLYQAPRKPSAAIVGPDSVGIPIPGARTPAPVPSLSLALVDVELDGATASWTMDGGPGSLGSPAALTTTVDVAPTSAESSGSLGHRTVRVRVADDTGWWASLDRTLGVLVLKEPAVAPGGPTRSGT